MMSKINNYQHKEMKKLFCNLWHICKRMPLMHLYQYKEFLFQLGKRGKHVKITFLLINCRKTLASSLRRLTIVDAKNLINKAFISELRQQWGEQVNCAIKNEQTVNLRHDLGLFATHFSPHSSHHFH